MYTAFVNALEINTALPVKYAHRYNTYKEGKLSTLSILQLVLYLYLYMNYVFKGNKADMSHVCSST